MTKQKSNAMTKQEAGALEAKARAEKKALAKGGTASSLIPAKRASDNPLTNSDLDQPKAKKTKTASE